MTFEKEAANETYESVRRLVYSLVKKFTRRFDLPWDDAVSAANFGYALAYLSYDQKVKGATFPKWVSIKVWGSMQVELRTKIRLDRYPIDWDEWEFDDMGKEEMEGFRVDEFLGGLSDDAKRVVTMALTEPPGVKRIVREFGEDTTDNVRMAIKEVLRRATWSTERIKRTWREVREALA